MCEIIFCMLICCFEKTYFIQVFFEVDTLVLCVAALVGQTFLLEEGSRSNPS